MSSAPASESAALRLHTLGGFRVWRQGVEIDPAQWGREKAVHLLQFLVTMRRRPLHKEEIIERLWPHLNAEMGDRDFKVALSVLMKGLEPERKPRAPPRFIRRFDLAYGLDRQSAWVDADAFEDQVAAGNRALPHHPEGAVEHYRAAAVLYTGDYLPERRYEDWSSAERERLQTLALGAMTTLAGLLVERNPSESLHLTQTVLARDPAWEDAYRIQMRAHVALGNRALALRTYQQCATILQQEFGLEPLPETQALYWAIQGEK